MKGVMLLLIATILFPYSALAQETPSGETVLDALLVYGKDFLFSVKEPSGWVGDIIHADKYSANIVFYATSETLETAPTIIRVRLNDKVDENTQEDLSADMKEYQVKYPEIEFSELPVAHPTYRIFSKLFSVSGEFYEYVAYLNPGPQKKMLFSVSMNKQRMAASASEVETFQKIVSSLQLLKAL